MDRRGQQAQNSMGHISTGGFSLLSTRVGASLISLHLWSGCSQVPSLPSFDVVAFQFFAYVNFALSVLKAITVSVDLRAKPIAT
jgi:hypothetical protein